MRAASGRAAALLSLAQLALLRRITSFVQCARVRKRSGMSAATIGAYAIVRQSQDGNRQRCRDDGALVKLDIDVSGSEPLSNRLLTYRSTVMPRHQRRKSSSRRKAGRLMRS